MTDYRTVKAWFQRCRDGANAVNAKKEEIQRLKDRATKITPNMSGMPNGSGGMDKTACAEMIVDAERELYRMEEELELLCLKATRRAYLITDNPEQCEAIYEFFVNGKTQSSIAYKQNVFDTQTVAARINAGCKKLAEIWDELEAGENVHFTQRSRDKI